MIRYKPLKCVRVSQPYYQRVNDFFCFLECTPNSNFPANYEDNENDNNNANHPNNKNDGNYPENKYMLKVSCRKKPWYVYG